jgi:formate/nitrite transporter FocA (FNT family)
VPIWFCISAFVALGLEHSIANMFIIPLGIFSGASVSWPTFLLKNLLPVTLGNTFGGAVCVALAFCMAYGKLGKKE